MSYLKLASLVMRSGAAPVEKVEMLKTIDRLATDRLGVITAETARTGRHLKHIRRILHEQTN